MSIMTVVVWSEIKGNFYFQLPAFQKPSLKKIKAFFLLAFRGTWGLWSSVVWWKAFILSFSSEHRQSGIMYMSGPGTATEERGPKDGQNKGNLTITNEK